MAETRVILVMVHLQIQLATVAVTTLREEVAEEKVLPKSRHRRLRRRHHWCGR